MSGLDYAKATADALRAVGAPPRELVIAHECIVADPPWAFEDRLARKGRGAENHYRVMPIGEICRYPWVTETPSAMLPPQSRPRFSMASDAILFLWRVSAMVPEALRVCEAWGFTPKSEIVWVKTTQDSKKLSFGMGHTVRNCHETCIIAKRGKPKITSRSVRSVFEAPVGAHSEKPDKFFELVEELCEGPRLELFARKRRAGWTQMGDELR